MNQTRTHIQNILVIVLATFLLTVGFGGTALAAVSVPINGEIERITIFDINDVWSQGEIVVAGQIVTVPRNLLIDLPANRLTLQQIFAQAPAACVAAGETGLAKADTCNTSGTGGFATISANRVRQNTIAGDVFIQKGVEVVSGVVTYIDYNDGYFRLNGNTGDPLAGVMVRLNDPTARHTIQQGLGCAAVDPATGRVPDNCSSDPRFTLDPDNYTNVFTTGYPLCIPSTVPRRFVDVLDIDGDLNTTERITARSSLNGRNDELCPDTNRSILLEEPPVADSRRFAPILRGDSVTAEGNFEKINGVKFLSSHTTMVLKALRTQNVPGQPDYLFLDEVGIDAPAFQNQRARTLIIGYATLAFPNPNSGADILVWSLHRGVDNAVHEMPLATTRGCDQAAGRGTCTNQGLVGQGGLIFKIVHDADFLQGADPKLDPCAHIRADARFNADRVAFNLCPAATASTADMLRVLSPIPHEIQARTGHSLANPGLITLDIKGDQAANGQYLFPFGVNLGGIGFPEMNEINLNVLFTPSAFSGIPWLMDRRLSPGGCIDTNGDDIVDCEGTPQPLVPFPYEQYDPRTQIPNFPAGTANRMFSFYPFGANDNFVALGTWPPATQAPIPVVPTPALDLVCGPAAPVVVPASLQAHFGQ